MKIRLFLYQFLIIFFALFVREANGQQGFWSDPALSKIMLPHQWPEHLFEFDVGVGSIIVEGQSQNLVGLLKRVSDFGGNPDSLLSLYARKQDLVNNKYHVFWFRSGVGKGYISLKEWLGENGVNIRTLNLRFGERSPKDTAGPFDLRNQYDRDILSKAVNSEPFILELEGRRIVLPGREASVSQLLDVAKKYGSIGDPFSVAGKILSLVTEQVPRRNEIVLWKTPNFLWGTGGETLDMFSWLSGINDRPSCRFAF